MHAASRSVDATHVVAQFRSSAIPKHRLRRIELWHNPAFPFGVVRYHATLADLEPFTAHVYSYGETFKSLLNIPLAKVRAMTPNGQYEQLPQGIGV